MPTKKKRATVKAQAKPTAASMGQRTTRRSTATARPNAGRRRAGSKAKRSVLARGAQQAQPRGLGGAESYALAPTSSTRKPAAQLALSDGTGAAASAAAAASSAAAAVAMAMAAAADAKRAGDAALATAERVHTEKRERQLQSGYALLTLPPSKRHLERSLSALASNCTELISLSLWGQPLGPAGAQRVASALRGNAFLRELCLGDVGMRDAGAAALADALKHGRVGLGKFRPNSAR